MNIALIYPRLKYPSGDPPLGLASLASSVLTNLKNVEVNLIDLTFHASLDYLKDIFRKHKYDLVCLTAATIFMPDVLKIAKLCKKLQPGCKIIIGGPHPSSDPEDAIGHREIDGIVIGEAEETCVEIVKAFLDNGELSTARGFWFKKGKKIIRSERREPIKDLDKVPFPAWHLLEMEKYFKYWFQMDCVSLNLRGTSMVASRGCPYKCSFCQPTLWNMFGRKIRYRSTGNVVDEIAELKKRYNVSAVWFVDDTFTIDKRWVKEFCEKLINRRLNIVWGCTIRANLADKDLLRLMKKSGCRLIGIGIESASQRILDEIYNKNIKVAQVKEAVRVTHSLGIKLRGQFMIGAPTETLEEIKRTIRFAYKLDLDEATFSITSPLPHTFLYEMAKKKGWLNVKGYSSFDYYDNYAFKPTAGLDTKALIKLKRKAFIKFYSRPRRFIALVKNLLNPRAFRHNMLKLKRF